MTDYLAKFGKRVVENGYKIVPIRPRATGESEKFGKAPGLMSPWQLMSGWQQLDWSTKDVERAVGEGNGRCGIGVITKDNPAADIDCHEAAVVEQIKAYIVKKLGSTIERVGNAPKTLLLFRTDVPFAKVTSKGYVDDHDRPAKLEILGQGQQFVALAQHPVTGAPYIWSDGLSVADRKRSDLPLMTHADALDICAEFDRLAAGAGWGVTGEASRGNFRIDDPFISDAPKVTDLTQEEMYRRLQACPNDDDYDTWVQVGMALFHQFEGSDTGLDWWLEWSDRSLKCDTAFCRQKWESGTFNVEGTGLQPTTFRFILKRSEAAEAERIAVAYDRVMEAISGAKTKEALLEATKQARLLDINELDRKEIASRLRSVFKEVVPGSSLTVVEAGRLVRYAPTQMPDVPDWLEGFVYVAADKGFFNLRTGRSISTEVFDAVHGRLVLTPQQRLAGETKPEHRPSDVALNRHTVPVVEDRRYAPDEPSQIFTINDVPYVNSYAERGLPMVPETPTAAGELAVKRIRDHIRHLIANERDAAIFTSFLAYIAQTKGRVNWAVFLQGTQGDGKTFFNIMMGAVLGADNVNVIGGHSLEEQYTNWSENSLMVFVEEVRLGGEHRYKVIDRVKPFITNPVVSVRRMRRDIYLVPNKASYFLISNFRDALPIDDEDNRYFPIFSRWQSQEDLNAFKAENPTYYRDLYGSLNEAGAIRKWLLGYKLSPDFDPADRAKSSSSKAEMVEAGRDEQVEAVREVIRGSNAPDFCPVLIDNAKIMPALYEANPGTEMLRDKRLHIVMQKAGYTSLGQVKVDGKVRRFWTSEPTRFRRLDADGMTVTNTDAVRYWLSDDL